MRSGLSENVSNFSSFAGGLGRNGKKYCSSWSMRCSIVETCIVFISVCIFFVPRSGAGTIDAEDRELLVSYGLIENGAKIWDVWAGRHGR